MRTTEVSFADIMVNLAGDIKSLCALGVSPDGMRGHIVHKSPDAGEELERVKKVLKPDEYFYWSRFGHDVTGLGHLFMRSMDRRIHSATRAQVQDYVNRALAREMSRMHKNLAHLCLVAPFGALSQTEVWGRGIYHLLINTRHARLVGSGCIVYAWKGQVLMSMPTSSESFSASLPTELATYDAGKVLVDTSGDAKTVVLHFTDGSAQTVEVPPPAPRAPVQASPAVPTELRPPTDHYRPTLTLVH